MGTRPTVRAAWGVAVILVGAGADVQRASSQAGTAPAPRIAAPSVSPPPPTIELSVTRGPITQVVLERVPGGPAYDWQSEHIVLRRPAGGDPEASAAFVRLARFLEKSGFFTRKSGYSDPTLLFPDDIGHLMIKVTRSGRTFQVWSYNGLRDKELSQTENAVRRTARLMRPSEANHHRQRASRGRD